MSLQKNKIKEKFKKTYKFFFFYNIIGRERGKKQFFKTIYDLETMTLATSDKNITMRTVSPVFYNNSILMVTHPESTKYKQLKK